jgi:predicted dehydrogenase
MKIQPFVIGSGGAGKAIAKSIAIVGILHPELGVLPVRWLRRDENIPRDLDPETALLCIANPHGFHARYLEEASAAGLKYILTEKPSCVSLEEVASLKKLGESIGVFHGYRQMWGPQTVRTLLTSGELGELVAIEGRYWQSSAAQKALHAVPTDSWKNNPKISGPHDVYLDLGTHWTDLMFFLTGETPSEARAWLSYANAESAHRDTHVHLTLDFAGGCRSFGSISKTMHGAGNHLEFTVLGKKQAVHWSFADPDRLSLARGSETLVVSKMAPTSSQQAPFHGLGWLEGYVDIVAQVLLEMAGGPKAAIPTLQENLKVVETLLQMAAHSKWEWKRDQRPGPN